jgi:YD repeat-containing protein
VAHGELTWCYEYDGAGRLAAETDFNGATIIFQNDPAGQLVRRLTAAGQETTYAYDVLGNLVSQVADGAVTTFGYDAAGRLVHARNASAEISFSRDALGRVTAETCNGHTVAVSYDAAGRVVGRVTPSGAETRWAYDAVGLPVTMIAASQELRFGYGPGGREARRELPAG